MEAFNQAYQELTGANSFKVSGIKIVWLHRKVLFTERFIEKLL